MSNDDKRRRLDGDSTAKLSVADLIARREAETQPIPRITEDLPARGSEETVRFTPTANLSGRELHVTELLKREGRAGEEERGGGFSVPKIVAMAGGGVVLAGTVAFSATNLLSSPDERPPAEVRFDARPAARATNTLTKDLGAAAAKQQETQQAQVETTTTTPEPTTTQRPQRTQQQAPRQTTAQEQAPSTTAQAPTAVTEQTTTPPPSTGTTTPAPPSSTPPASPTSSSTAPPSSDASTPPSSAQPSPTPPSSTAPSSSAPSSSAPSSSAPSAGIGVGLDLGGLLDPIGGFDFFAPGN
ncbi:hypothetical protein ACFFSW_31920 [Saccharothrix longispora]|uniref:Outer membrane biosynthesis protein TonB n=1 Tax=Saccharothrix longispora TaxID=33920 RepID=A0ABU1Q1J1_9PSEU|nr:hypothetical protein [Saccharothrix longispora]MDR6596756.1 outer membrane biosynthesis protein TonB [Saccharothrix longispora]